MITQHQLVDIGTQVVVACSILHSFLPPWDFLNDFPRAQKYYKVAIYVIGYIGLNARSTVYQSVSMKNQNKTNGNGNGNGTTSTPGVPKG